MCPKLSSYSFVKQKPARSFISIVIDDKRTDLKINKSAENILSMCNGFYSSGEILKILLKKYQDTEENVFCFIEDIVSKFMQINAITDERIYDNDKKTRGSAEINLPDSIIWELTDYCPLNCLHCYLDKREQQIVSKSDIDIVMSKIIDYGVTTVQLTGGEPLTHPDLKYIIDKLVENKLKVTVATSGYHFNDEIFSVLENLKNVNGAVQVSIDALGDAHNHIRQRPDAFFRSIRFIKEIVKRNIHCAVATSLISQPEEELEKLTVFLKSIGVEMQTYGKTLFQGNAKSNELEIIYTHSKIKKLIETFNTKHSNDNFSIRNYHETLEANCGAGHNLIRIKPNLDITPCPMIDTTMGNLKESKFELRFGKKSHIFCNLRSPDQQFCQACTLKDHCGRCTATGLNNRAYCEGKCFWFDSQSVEFKTMLKGEK